ncbi:UNVERIFIED_CONTAM: hypothetical protein K2H54_050339 [Gekko kuhli]
MSGEEGHGTPATTADHTLVTTAIVLVSTTPPVSVFGGGTIPRYLYPMPYYTPRAPQYLSGIRGMPGMSPLRWSEFNVESMQETYLLTQGPRRDSQFDVGLFQEEDEEENDVEQRLDTLKRAQRKFNRDLEEVIRAIPDMVVRALQVERAA